MKRESWTMMIPLKSRLRQAPSRNHKMWFIGFTIAVITAFAVSVVIPAWTAYRGYEQAKAILPQIRRDGAETDMKGLKALQRPFAQDLGQIAQGLNGLAWMGWVPDWGSRLVASRDLADALAYDAQALGAFFPVLNGSHPTGFELVGHAWGRWVYAMRRAWPALEAAAPYWQQLNVGALPSTLRKYPVSPIRTLMVFGTRLARRVIHHPSVWANILGIRRPAHYLLIFQNSGELRASGGFITADGTLTVSHAKIIQAQTQAVELLSRSYPIPAPFLLRHFFGLKVWGLANAGLSPDIPTTAHVIERQLRSIGVPVPRTGIIFINSWAVDELLSATGPVTIPPSYTAGSPVTLTSSNANIEMEVIAERTGQSNATRKQFIGYLLGVLLHRIFSGGPTGWAALEKAIAGHNLMVYFNQPAAESEAAALGMAGQVRRHVAGDYLMVVDQNFGGYKDNYFLRERIATTVRRVGERWLQTVTVHFVLPRRWSWLVTGYPGWIQFYVPRGSRLVRLTGYGTNIERIGTDPALNKTIFGANFFVPTKSRNGTPGRSEVTVTYWLPTRFRTVQSVYVQPQPGTRDIPVAVHVVN